MTDPYARYLLDWVDAICEDLYRALWAPKSRRRRRTAGHRSRLRVMRDRSRVTTRGAVNPDVGGLRRFVT